MRTGGAILRRVVDELVPLVAPGMTTRELDAIATKKIIAYGAQPSFPTVKGYQWTLCTPINEQAVHTPPSSRKLEPGDVLSIDAGVLYDGLHTDCSTTCVVGDVRDEKIDRFLRVGQEALDRSIELIHAGARLGTMGKYMHDAITGAGYCVLRDLTGHGIGASLHEDPYVFNYLDKPVEKTFLVQPGLTIAVEIIYAMGSSEIAYEPNVTWSIISKDRSISACFEKTIAITEKDTFILT